MRYEDLLDDPARVVGDLATFVGVPARLPDFDDLEVGPVFQGNRVRHRRRLTLHAPVTTASPPQPEGSVAGTWQGVARLIEAPTRASLGYGAGAGGAHPLPHPDATTRRRTADGR